MTEPVSTISARATTTPATGDSSARIRSALPPDQTSTRSSTVIRSTTPIRSGSRRAQMVVRYSRASGIWVFLQGPPLCLGDSGQRRVGFETQRLAGNARTRCVSTLPLVLPHDRCVGCGHGQEDCGRARNRNQRGDQHASAADRRTDEHNSDVGRQCGSDDGTSGGKTGQKPAAKKSCKDKCWDRLTSGGLFGQDGIPIPAQPRKRPW
jgi:hypothetical protein